MKDKLLEKLRADFSGAIVSTNEFRDELTIVVSKNDILQVCKFLRDDGDLQFDSMRDLSGSDNYTPEGRFEVVYNRYSINNNTRLRLKVSIDETDLHVASVAGVWPAADWHEREAYDMYGIIFDNHPDLRRMYMPEEFEYYPLRKDFPLMGIPGSLPLPRK